MHWADVVAEKLLESGSEHVISSGITPSGPIHLGSMREILTEDAIVKAVNGKGGKAKLVYVADNADPLRKVYPFLEEEKYKDLVGFPLAEIPAPDGDGSYDQYFLNPFFEALERIGVYPEVVNNYRFYQEGRFEECTKNIIENCVYGDIDVDTMPTFDMEYIFLQLRGKAKGEIIDLKYKCPKCDGEIPVSINIDDVNISTADNHTKDIKLTDDLGVMMKYPTLQLQAKIEQLTKETNKIDALFSTVAHSIDYIYDKETTYPSKDHTDQEMITFIESLPDNHFQKLSNFFETAPALKHEVKLHCKHKVKGKGKEKKECGYKEPMKLEGLASFFA